MTEDLKLKYDRLRENLRALGSLVIAFSGGVDSTFLLKTAHDVLKDRALAVTLTAEPFPEREEKEASAFCEKEGIRQILCDVDVLSVKGFAQNPPDRCYICKKTLFSRMKDIAEKEKFAWVAEGSNLDDVGDYRPGLAAIEELGIISPLREAELSKSDIRALSKELGLSTWDKPSFACLATRFVYGEEITKEKLEMIAGAEQLLLDHGFRQLRVRLHGDLARIEVLPEDFDRLMQKDLRLEINEKFRALGFSYVTADLIGYRTGSMNEPLQSGTAML